MKTVIKITLTIAAFLLFLWLVISWYEADKEIEILCREISSGVSLKSAEMILGTGEYLHYEKVASSRGTSITMSSSYNAGASDCTVLFTEDDISVSSTFNQHLRLNWLTAWIGLLLFTGMALFHLLLALGAPFGKLAWGGDTRKLSVVLRAGSFIATCIFLIGGLMIAEQAGLVAIFKNPDLVDISVIILTALFALSAVTNQLWASRSGRRVMTPIFILLFMTCIIIALGP